MQIVIVVEDAIFKSKLIFVLPKRQRIIIIHTSNSFFILRVVNRNDVGVWHLMLLFQELAWQFLSDMPILVIHDYFINKLVKAKYKL